MGEDQEKAREIVTAYKNVFGSPDAGTVLGDLAIACKMFASSCLDESMSWASPDQTAFNEGRRWVLCRILRFAGLEDQIINGLEKYRGRYRTAD